MRTLSLMAVAVWMAGGVARGAVPATTDFDPVFFRTNALPVTIVGNLVDWQKLSTNAASSAMSGTVSNAVASAGLLAVDATKTNGVAATSAMVQAAAGQVWQATNANLTGWAAVPATSAGVQATLGQVYQATNANLTSWSAIAPSAKQDTGNYITSLTSDITASGPGAAVATLASVATAGTYGDMTHSLSAVLDAKGRVTTITSNAIPLMIDDAVNVSTNYLPPFTSQAWLSGTPINDGGSFSYAYGISPLSTRMTGTNITINSEKSADANKPFLYLSYQSPPGGVSNITFTVPFQGLPNGTIRIGAAYTDNPGSVTLTSFTSTNSVWSNAVVTLSTSNTFRLVVATAGSTNIGVGIPTLAFGSDYTNTVFAAPYKRWDTSQFTTQNNPYTSWSTACLSGFSPYSRLEFTTTATNLAIEIIQETQTYGTGDLTVFTNGVFCVRQTFTDNNAYGTSKLKMLSLPTLPPGNTKVTILNCYAENNGTGNHAGLAFVRGVFTDAGANLAFVRDPNPVTMLSYGDSITGQATDSTHWFSDLWTWQLERLTGIRVYMMQIGGGRLVDDATNWPSLWTAIRKVKPAYFFLQHGENDYALGAGVGVPTFTNDYAMILDTIHAISPQTRILCMTPITQTSEGAVGGYTLGDYRVGITTLVNARPQWCQLIDGTQLTNNATFKNSLHLTSAGNQLYAKLLRDAIFKMPAASAAMPFDANGFQIVNAARTMSFGGVATPLLFGGVTKVLTSATGADIFWLPVANTNAVGGTVAWEVVATDGTETQSQSGKTQFDAVAKGTAVTGGLTSFTNAAVVSAGTLTVGCAANTATNNVVGLTVTATTSLTTTNLVMKWRLETPSAFVVNPL